MKRFIFRIYQSYHNDISQVRGTNNMNPNPNGSEDDTTNKSPLGHSQMNSNTSHSIPKGLYWVLSQRKH